MSIPCLISAWSACEGELRTFLRHRTRHPEDAEEVLQEIFLKAMRQGKKFCSVENPRAWLFRVARNALIDRSRSTAETLPLPEDIQLPENEGQAPVEHLAQCLPRVLSELSEADRLALTLCDLEGRSQQVLADRLGISLSGAKSRLQRARKRLRARLESACQVRYDADGSVCCFTPRPPVGPER